MQMVEEIPSKRESIPQPPIHDSVYTEKEEEIKHMYHSGIKVNLNERNSQLRASKNYKNSSRNSIIRMHKSRGNPDEYNAEETQDHNMNNLFINQKKLSEATNDKKFMSKGHHQSATANK
jgi:hypothetical protein